MFSSLLKYQLKKRVAFAYERWSFNRGSPVFFFKSHTSNGNNINVCLRLTYLSSMKGKHSTRRLIVKQIFAETIKRFFFLKENHLVTHPLLIQLIWFRKWLFIFDSFLILSQTTHLSFTTTIYPLQWRIQGRDPEVRPPLLFYKLRQNCFLETAPPPSPPILGSEWSTSALISRSGSVTALRVTYYILHVYHSKTVLNGGTYFFQYKIWVPTCSWGSRDSPNDLASPGLRFPFLSC